jgi:hypothetical protein
MTASEISVRAPVRPLRNSDQEIVKEATSALADALRI